MTEGDQTPATIIDTTVANPGCVQPQADRRLTDYQRYDAEIESSCRSGTAATGNPPGGVCGPAR